MVSVYELKPKFQNLLRPLCTALARGGITANQTTVTAAVLSMALGFAIWATQGAPWTLFLLPPFLLLRMALNAIDGMLAREFGQKSRLGAILNELGDVVSDTALYLPFAAVPGVSALWAGLAVAIAIMTEMTGVVAIQIGAARRYDGPMGKSDRALWFGFLAVVLACAPGIARLADVYLGAVSALGVWTIFNRARAALKDGA